MGKTKGLDLPHDPADQTGELPSLVTVDGAWQCGMDKGSRLMCQCWNQTITCDMPWGLQRRFRSCRVLTARWLFVKRELLVEHSMLTTACWESRTISAACIWNLIKCSRRVGRVLRRRRRAPAMQQSWDSA